MTREWKPGDVAMVTGPARLISEVGKLATHRAIRSFDCWYIGKSRGWADSEVIDVRPLVVIDPESATHMDAVADAIWRQGVLEGTRGGATIAEREAITAALRSLIAPEKPAEPMGLAALVEDAEGDRWIRHGSGPRAWMLAFASPNNRDTYAWATIAAVKVLSPGVTP